MQSIPKPFCKSPSWVLTAYSLQITVSSVLLFPQLNYFPNIMARLLMIREIIILVNLCHFSLISFAGRFRLLQWCRSELTLLGWNVTGGLAFRLMKKIIVWLKITGTWSSDQGLWPKGWYTKQTIHWQYLNALTFLVAPFASVTITWYKRCCQFKLTQSNKNKQGDPDVLEFSYNFRQTTI